MTAEPPPPPEETPDVAQTTVLAPRAGTFSSVVAEPAERMPLALWLLLLFTVLMLVGAASAVVAVVRPKGHSDSYPDVWDPRVLPFVKVVQDQRDLEFFHPIYVDFLPDADFKKQVTRDEGALSDQDRAELDQAAGLLRATGFIGGDLDLFKAFNDLSGEGVIGLYSYQDKRIRVRGTELTPAVKQTLVHELTHALQDQHFDLAQRHEGLDKLKDNGTAKSIFQAIVEGDASRIETAYAEGLSKKERSALDKEKAAEARAYTQRTAKIPTVLQTMMASPYTLGEAMLEVAAKTRGNAGVNDLFLNPPTSDETLLDPWPLLAKPQRPLVVTKPALDPGDKAVDDAGPFGAISWYLMLSERVPLAEALRAADGWGGDSSIEFERSGKSCVRVAYAGDSPRDVVEMRQALDVWVAAHAGSASVRNQGAQLLFESCDPGVDAAPARDRSSEALSLALTRSAISASVYDQTHETTTAVCFSHRVLESFSAEQILGTSKKLAPAVQQKLGRLAASCMSHS